jgi:hypothetical protein
MFGSPLDEISSCGFRRPGSPPDDMATERQIPFDGGIRRFPFRRLIDRHEEQRNDPAESLLIGFVPLPAAICGLWCIRDVGPERFDRPLLPE